MERIFKMHLVLAVSLGFFVGGMESLRCYKCLNLDCPEKFTERRDNEKLYQSVRSFIVNSVKPYYELGEIGFIGPCPKIDEKVQWSLLQTNREQCPYIRESATCSLGRLQIVTITPALPDTPIISHATITGCLKVALLVSMKSAIESRSCSLILQNSTIPDNQGYIHSLKLENCGKISDYCNSIDFCIAYRESIVKPFIGGDGHVRAFETGFIIAIGVVIIVIILAIVLAGCCRNPLNRAQNYTPPSHQDNENRAIELDDVETKAKI